ncbi:hypothetical protein JV173_03885 [Acholeplasma equirhinis]|uniref:hypothetical protein n=1 Tax=Acholeplasma equirhinis TaxID=555393 RepID=UPI00197A74D3|nr:hypothetical protein [Acholeplasma equirhinis]MBN3490650.1 hypothetical protein [Acholeplasma equirhinis]
MTFEFVTEAINNLKNLASKDKKYKAITDRIATLLQDLSKEFLAFKETHEKVTRDTKHAHLITKQNHQDKMKVLRENYALFEKDTKDKIKALYLAKDRNIETLKLKTSKDIDKFNHEINELEEKLNLLNKQALTTKSKDLAYIEKVIADIKKQSAKSMHQIKQNAASELVKVEAKYQEDVLVIQKNQEAFEQNMKLEKERIVTSKALYREQSDSKYLSVKNDYHQASTAFNKKVDQLKKKKDDASNKLKSRYQESLVPIDLELKALEQSYQDLKSEHERIYSEKIETHKNQISVIIEKYNQKKEQIIKETSESITLYNSKLSAFREALIKDRAEQQKEYKEQRNLANNEDERKLLYKEFSIITRAQDAELNKQVQRTKKDTVTKTREQYQKLNQAEIEFLEDRSKWRIEGKILLINEKLENYYNEQNYQYKAREIETKLKKLKLNLDHDLELLDIKHLEAIAPLDKDLAVANAISERDINLLSNDTNYHLNHFQHQEDTIDHKIFLYQLECQEQLEKLRIKLEYDKNVLMMTEQLSLEKETVILEQRLKNQELKQNLTLSTFEVTNLTNELEFLLEKTQLSTEINYKIKEQKILNDSYHDETSSFVSDLDQEIKFENDKVYYQDQLSQIDTEMVVLNKELDIIHSRIHYLFNQVYIVYNVHHHFMLELINLYQLPAHPEDVKQYITLYLEVFRELSNIQTSAIDEFLVDMQSYHETRFNDLTNHHYQTNLKVLTTNFQTSMKALDDELNGYNVEIQKIDNQIMVLESNIDRIQSKINVLEIKQSEIQDKKENKKYQVEIEDLQKQINSIETEMQKLDKEIQKFNKPMDKIKTLKDNLSRQFELEKDNLISQQQKDTKIYFQQLTFYKNLMKKLSTLFVNYESKIGPLTEKLNQPIYLTEDMIKEYEKNFKRLEASFEKQSHVLYQSLLKGSILLFEKLNKDQSNLKSNFLKEQKDDLEAHEKILLTNRNALDLYRNRLKAQLASLEKEKILSIETSIENIKQTKLSEIETLKNQIKAFETQILQTEEKIKNELILIDSNLTSVITQLDVEFQKNLTKSADTFMKSNQKANDQMDLKIKNLKSLEETTQLKNGLLNTRFQQTEVKLNEQLKEKLASYLDQTTKKNLLHQKRLTSIEQELKQSYEKKESMILSFKKKSEHNANQIQVEEKRMLDKDLKDANQSYQFKQRTLKV